MATLTEAQVKVLRLLVNYDMSFDTHEILKFANVKYDDCDTLSEAELIERDMHWGNWHITDAGRAAIADYDTKRALKQHGAHGVATVDALPDTSKDAEIAALKQRVAALEGALRPFALAARDVDIKRKQDNDELLVMDAVYDAVNIGAGDDVLMVKDLREAAKVLGE